MDKIDLVIENIREILELRGDNIESFIEDEKKYTASSIYATFTSSSHVKMCSDKTCVIFAMSLDRKKQLISELKIKAAKKNVDTDEQVSNSSTKDEYKTFIANNDLYKNYIFVFSHNLLTSNDKHVLESFEKELEHPDIEGKFTVFNETELYFNPIKHELVDPHRKLSKDEIKHIMKVYNIKSKQTMPVIPKSDVISRRLGLLVGDIVEITRSNKNNGFTKTYKVCKSL